MNLSKLESHKRIAFKSLQLCIDDVAYIVTERSISVLRGRAQPNIKTLISARRTVGKLPYYVESIQSRSVSLCYIHEHTSSHELHSQTEGLPMCVCVCVCVCIYIYFQDLNYSLRRCQHGLLAYFCLQFVFSHSLSLHIFNMWNIMRNQYHYQAGSSLK
jgi:hypothetical protein